jgi:hypothetical protein
MNMDESMGKMGSGRQMPMGDFPDKNAKPPSRMVSMGGMDGTPVMGKTMMSPEQQAILTPKVTEHDRGM